MFSNQGKAQYALQYRNTWSPNTLQQNYRKRVERCRQMSKTLSRGTRSTSSRSQAESFSLDQKNYSDPLYIRERCEMVPKVWKNNNFFIFFILQIYVTCLQCSSVSKCPDNRKCSQIRKKLCVLCGITISGHQIHCREQHVERYSQMS